MFLRIELRADERLKVRAKDESSLLIDLGRSAYYFPLWKRGIEGDLFNHV